ncbi:RES domain-containing protein [Pseudomonas sp. SJZ079]|uniref:RES family NAD+ phosphorylase n=1 Tax=Pseudomonas sp. SJZ079 TaxID=2572887 RepID=UPI00119AF2D6|nr:RES family NAD+ phosphorylase [Pseudomonas sp. SJZ079]TWC35065.1 RES domain-containing protein [Pseudomonas sp. SJZ079]
MFSSDIYDDEIRNRISDFRSCAEAGISDKGCMEAVSSIFGNMYSFAAETKQYEQGTTFFRARAIPPHDTSIPLQTIRQVGDAWEPPAHVVKVQGRINAVNQSILYCCAGDPSLAIDEARASESKHVAIMVYRSSRPINTAVLGDYENSSLPKDHRSKLFYSFLDEEFSKAVPPGSEGRYSITRAIADTFFNYPEQDAWCYRSVQSSEKFNVAFLPGKSKLCLDLLGVMICDLTVSTPGALNVKFVVDFDEVSGNARYHQIGSEEQRRIFPEIK